MQNSQESRGFISPAPKSRVPLMLQASKHLGLKQLQLAGLVPSNYSTISSFQTISARLALKPEIQKSTYETSNNSKTILCHCGKTYSTNDSFKKHIRTKEGIPGCPMYNLCNNLHALIQNWTEAP